MNEHKAQMGFYLVLPSMSNNEIFVGNHAGNLQLCYQKKSIWMKNFIGKWH